AELRARRLELHQHVVGGAVQELALFGQDEPAGVAVEQGHRQFLLQRADLSRHRRLRETELLTRLGEAARLGGGVENLQLVPVHGSRPTGLLGPPHGAGEFCTQIGMTNRRTPSRSIRYSAAARRSSCTARNRSASSAAMQPRPAAVTAWR